MKADVMVLGAGAIGVSTALHLQARGQDVVLIDRQDPGQGTSFGNAGLIQREGVYPYAFPRDLRSILDALARRSPAVHYHARSLPGLLPFLLRYWRNSAPQRHAQIAHAYATLIEHSVSETRALCAQAGLGDLLHPSGWIKAFRTPAAQDRFAADAELWHGEYGVRSTPLDRAGLAAMEPNLSEALIGGIHFTEPDTLTDPGGYVAGLARHFQAQGGRFASADAAALEQDGAGWRVGEIAAPRAVLAMGPWAEGVTRRLGYRFVLAVKRGYHMHYRPAGNAVLHRPVLDIERGYILAPMARGIRLCTGAEFALRDAPRTPVQLAQAEPVARATFPLGEQVDAAPWMGARPCTPDMMPIIGPAPRHPGLWFGFGHAHHGMTLGALTGRLLAEQITGETPLVETAPFRADRETLN